MRSNSVLTKPLRYNHVSRTNERSTKQTPAASATRGITRRKRARKFCLLICCAICSIFIQSLHMRADGCAERLQVVAAFEAGDDAPRTGARGPCFDRARHRVEVFVFKPQLAERVARVRVEAGRDDDEVGRELRVDL